MPAQLRLPDLAAIFPRNSDWSGGGQLGREHREFTYVWLDIPEDDRQLRAWLDDDLVVLVDAAYAGTWTAQQVHQVFGRPAAALDTWRATVPLPESELVYADRGLTVFVDHEADTLWHLALYAPTTLQKYTDELRISLRTLRFPARRDVSY